MGRRTLFSSLAVLSSVACAAPGPPPVAAPPPARVAPVASSAPTPLQAAAAPSEEGAAVPVLPGNPTWGSRTALVTIVEFSDFQCPFCRRVQPTLAVIREEYGPEKLRIVWKNKPLPFHDNARPAAEAAAGVFAVAGNEAFWKFHDLAFRDQAPLGRDSYLKWAREVGVQDLASYAAGLDSHQWAFAVDRDDRESETLNAEGTPTFFVNGSPLVGAQPPEVFRKRIDEELRKAEAQLASGTSSGLLYAKQVAENRAAPRQDDEAEKTQRQQESVFKIPVGKAPVRGSPSALVTIIEFADFQCPFCVRAEETLKALRAKYGDKLRLVWRHEPLAFHKAAEPAAEAALEVRAEKGDAAFWDVHDRFLAGQSGLMVGDQPDQDAIVELAVAAGANQALVRKAIAAQTHRRDIEADEDMVDDFQASGTPHFFINGHRLVGAQPQEQFEKIIDDEIAKAQKLVAAGTKPTEVYAALTRDGAIPPEPETKDLRTRSFGGDPVLGDPGARVVLHEFSDFQCPFCQRVEATLRRVAKEYEHRVKIVWHDLPLAMHPDAARAAQAGREAFSQKGAAGFWALHDKIFSNQARLTRADLDGYARELNLDMTRWAQALDGGTHASEIDADVKVANDAGIEGTPGFVVASGNSTSGYFINGAASYPKFRKLIERALAEKR